MQLEPVSRLTRETKSLSKIYIFNNKNFLSCKFPTQPSHYCLSRGTILKENAGFLQKKLTSTKLRRPWY